MIPVHIQAQADVAEMPRFEGVAVVPGADQYEVICANLALSALGSCGALPFSPECLCGIHRSRCDYHREPA